MSADIGYLQTKISELTDIVNKVVNENEKIKQENSKLKNQYEQLQTKLIEAEVNIDSLAYLADAKNEFEDKLQNEVLTVVIPKLRKHTSKLINVHLDSFAKEINAAYDLQQKSIINILQVNEDLITMRLNVILGILAKSVIEKYSNEQFLEELKKAKFKPGTIGSGQVPKKYIVFNPREEE